MKKYSLTSTQFKGEVFFSFSDDGNLSQYDARGADLTVEQLAYIGSKMPKHLAHIKRLIENSDTAKLTEITEEITFDRFWNRYNDKARSSKKRTQRIWNRMSKAQQRKAYQHIQKYELTLKPGIDRKYAETYLNAELWNN